MKIYFACSITGGRKDEKNYSRIVSSLMEAGHQVPTAYLASQDVIRLEKMVDPIEVYKRDVNWIQECDVLIAEVSTPSHGVGYEIGYALNRSVPVVCVFQEGTTVSKMILGNPNPNLYTFAYRVIEEALEFIREHLAKIRPGNSSEKKQRE